MTPRRLSVAPPLRADVSKCANGCGARMSLPGICSNCAGALREREHWLSMGPAFQSIPKHYREARWGSPVLYERVPDLVHIKDADPARLLSASVLILHGKTRAGKTSLACALGRWIVESTRPESDAGLLDRARLFRFVDARDVPTPRFPEGPPQAAIARRASVLLLDDVGQEAGEGGGYVNQDRCREVADLLTYVDKHDKQIIITTGATPGEWSAMYGAGVAARFWENPDAQIIELHRRRK